MRCFHLYSAIVLGSFFAAPALLFSQIHTYRSQTGSSHKVVNIFHSAGYRQDAASETPVPVDPFTDPLPLDALQETSNNTEPATANPLPELDLLPAPKTVPLPDPFLADPDPNAVPDATPLQEGADATTPREPLPWEELPSALNTTAQENSDNQPRGGFDANSNAQSMIQPLVRPTGTNLLPVNWINMPPVNRSRESASAARAQAAAGDASEASPLWADSQTPNRRPYQSLSFRFKSAPQPQPLLSPLHPAVVHIPVRIQVVPTFFDYPFYGFYRPIVPIYIPVYSDNYRRSNEGFLPDYYRNPQGANAPTSGSEIDYRMHPLTDQRPQHVSDPNLIGQASNSVDFVGYPHNFYSYPGRSVHGVYIQSFPVSNRMDR